MIALNIDAIKNSPGYFRVQKVRNGSWLPGRFWITEQRDPTTNERVGDDRYFAEIGTEPVDPFDPPGWPYSWRKIERDEWLFLHDDLRWALRYEPNGPRANADRPARETERTLF